MMAMRIHILLREVDSADRMVTPESIHGKFPYDMFTCLQIIHVQEAVDTMLHSADLDEVTVESATGIVSDTS